jgi:plasmid stabilization system protein ParE
MATVALVRRAARQAKRVGAWWRENRTASPDLFASELAAAIDALAAAPQIGQRIDDAGLPGIRRVLLRASQFHVYYDLDGTTVRIVAVWSGLRGCGPDLS